MKIIQTMAAVVMAAAAFHLQAADENPELNEARALVKEFGTTLKGEVQKGMQEGGPVHTIDVCSKKAPDIAKDISHKSGWEVARTSLKYRNPGNAPDEWEREVLEQFEARKNAGEPVQSLEFAELVGSGEDRRFRYMKAIATGEVCLNCHATEIKPEVEAKIKDIYPTDQARGFKTGDIRGAFSLSKIY